jgi:uncharacterized protein YjiS (DUF1127 family)
MTGVNAMEPKMQAPLLALLQALADGYRQARLRRRARRQALQLRSMSEHELRDLGIGRSEIPSLLDAGRGAR